jgi:hypothetical protein
MSQTPAEKRINITPNSISNYLKKGHYSNSHQSGERTTYGQTAPQAGHAEGIPVNDHGSSCARKMARRCNKPCLKTLFKNPV